MRDRRKLQPEVQAAVRERARALCEYCHSAEQWQYVPFTVDHIVPLAQEGADDLDNLALACFHCNRRKSSRMSGPDPVSGEVVSLFHPRRQSWAEHFIWSVDGLFILPTSSVGRATATFLEFNRERALFVRGADLQVGRHPPADDPRLKDLR